MFEGLANRADLPVQIGLLRPLADNLDAAARKGGPGCAPLGRAPELRLYQLSLRPIAVLTGCCTAHPTLREGPTMTSEVCLLDPRRRWVRTLSRSYRLGEPAPDRLYDDPGRRS